MVRGASASTTISCRSAPERGESALLSLSLLLIAIAAIVWGTKVTLDNAVRLARHYQISDFFIGVAILAVGSDLPEVVVSVAAALRQLGGEDTANLIVGNALGSCLGQFGLVMGVAGLMGRVTLPRPQVLLHGGVLLLSMLLLLGVGWDGVVSRFEGGLLTSAFLLYLGFLMGEEHVVEKARLAPAESMLRVWLSLAGGMLVVVLSAEVIVESALKLAELWGVDQSFIGIVIVGVGTSLPELMISVGAALRSRMGISVGNLVGSNILDVLLPVGLAALLTPLRFAAELLRFDLPVLFGITLLVLGSLLLRGGLRRPQGLLVLTVYGSYIGAKALAVG